MAGMKSSVDSMTKVLVLLRGIAVRSEDADRVRETILNNGILGNEGKRWSFDLNDLRGRLEDLFNNPVLSLSDTRPPRQSADYFPVTCACGDEIGASYYALQHNKHEGLEEVSYVIRFRAPLWAVYLDGRDFLYTCFQLWDRETRGRVELQKQLISKIFGMRIARYFEKATTTSNHGYRLALCDLACQDPLVVKHHATNRLVIGGRFGTCFSSAFFVRTPIGPESIVAVEIPKSVRFQPQLTLNDFLRGTMGDLDES